jgi:hypothetical protein
MCSVNASQEPTTSERIETFVADKRRIALGLIACVIFWALGIVFSNRLLGKDRDDWTIVVLGISLSFLGSFTVRVLLHQMRTRIAVHADAIAFFRKGQMKLIPWNDIVRIRVDWSKVISFSTAVEEFSLNLDLFKGRSDLQTLIYREAIAHGIPWSGYVPGCAENRTSPMLRRPLRLSVRLVGILVIASGWSWFICTIPFFSDMGLRVRSFLPIGIGGAIIAVAWVVLSVALPSLFDRHFAKWWLSVLLAGILGIVLAATNWALAARVALCEQDLRAHVQTMKPDECDIANRRVGLFDVEMCEEHDGGVYLYSFSRAAGIAYRPNGGKPPSNMRLDGSLFGSWYRVKSHD